MLKYYSRDFFFHVVHCNLDLNTKSLSYKLRCLANIRKLFQRLVLNMCVKVFTLAKKAFFLMILKQEKGFIGMNTIFNCSN